MNSIINLFSESPDIFIYTAGAFCTLQLIRELLFKRTFFILLFHFLLLCFSIFVIMGGGGVQNDAYKRLDQFLALEKENKLVYAQTHPEEYDSMFQIDLGQFKSSDEFKSYLEEQDKIVDRTEAITVGWLFLLLSELVTLIVTLFSAIFKRKKS